MRVKILTLFPDMLAPVLHGSILGRAVERGLIEVELVNLRDFSEQKHKNTDDYPFGGGAGMVMLPQVVCDAVEKSAETGMRRVYLSPRGRAFTQKVAEEYAAAGSLLLLCGHYEGVDQRALDLSIDEELSIGDFVLTGGELGALVVTDAVARLVPGVLGSDESSEDESFTTGLLEYPQYTRPADFRGLRVPEVLLGGNHADITAWRRREALDITRKRRPDLLDSAPLTDADRETLKKLERADALQKRLEERGVRAERMEMFFEAGFEKQWIERFVAPELAAKARKVCRSGRRHVGYLDQAFTQGFCASAEPFSIEGSAYVYYDRDGIGFAVDRAEALGSLPAHTVLTDTELNRSIAAGADGQLFYIERT